MPLEPERRQALLGAKLAALVKDEWGEGIRRPSSFPGGAALTDPAGSSGWVLVEDRPARALGGALAWSRRAGVDDMHLLVEDGVAAGNLARRATLFANPPHVWLVSGRSVDAAGPVPLAPEPPAPSDGELAEAIRAAGAEPVVEHGKLLGEVLGLEVCRVGAEGWLEVGVGKHDREAQAEINADRPPLDSLARAVAVVKEYRRAGAPTHPANQLVRERWLRAVVMARPELAGLPAGTRLTAASAPAPRADLRDPAPAPAVADDLIVVCSTGIHTDLVPAAADAWLAAGRPDDFRLVLPEGDDHPITRDLAAGLRRPAAVHTVTKDWPAAYPES